MIPKLKEGYIGKSKIPRIKRHKLQKLELPPKGVSTQFLSINEEIQDQDMIDNFLNQSFKIDKIGTGHDSEFNKTLKINYLTHRVSGGRRTRTWRVIRYALPEIRQFDDDNMRYYTLHEPSKQEIASEVERRKKAARNDDDSDSEYESDDEDEEDSDGPGYYAEKDYAECKHEAMEVKQNKCNLIVIGSMDRDIGVLLNNVVVSSLEKDVEDYLYPQRNRQIIAEIMRFRGRNASPRMHYFYRRIKDENALLTDGLYGYHDKKHTEEDTLRKVSMIQNHDELFWKWKLRIHDLVDPSLLVYDFGFRSNKYEKVGQLAEVQRKRAEKSKIDWDASSDDDRDSETGELIIKEPKNDDAEIDISDNWIPAIFRKNKDENIEIVSDINNLSRARYPKLYRIIGAVFKKMLPSFEWISGCDFDKENMNEYKVIIKMMNYELFHMRNGYKSMIHREGAKEENIIAVGIYYYYISDAIYGDTFNIYHGYRTGEYESSKIEQDVKIKQDEFIVFNNRYGFEHYISKLNNISMTYPVKRKILAFFMVDPKAKNCKTSMDIAVNICDKLGLIVTNWSRECVMKKILSDDIINLISIFSMDQRENVINKNVNKLIDFLQDAEHQYVNRPRPRRKN